MKQIGEVVNAGAAKAYEQTATELQRRIEALGPQILTVTSAWQLFKVPGFHCDDLQPSLAQAQYALRGAQTALRGRG